VSVARKPGRITISGLLLLVTVCSPFALAQSGYDATDAISREFSVLVNPDVTYPQSDAISREVSVLVGRHHSS
jgi:hypothetical protein